MKGSLLIFLIFNFSFLIVVNLKAQKIEIIEGFETACRNKPTKVALVNVNTGYTNLKWYWEGKSNNPLGNKDTITIKPSDYPENTPSIFLKAEYTLSGETIIKNKQFGFIEIPDADLGYSRDTISSCGNNKIELKDKNNPESTDIWNTGDIGKSITISDTGTYILTKESTIKKRCKGSDTVNVIKNKPKISVNSDTTICPGDTTFLTIDVDFRFGKLGPELDYNWFSSVNLNGNLDTDSLMVSPESKTTYYGVLTDEVGCKDTASATVKINDISLNTNFNDTLMCASDTVTIDLFPSGGRPFVNGEPYKSNISPEKGIKKNSYSSIMASPSKNTNYNITVNDAMGCKDSAKVKIETRSLNVEIQQPDTITMCTINDSTKINTKVNGINPPFSYQWNNKSPFISNDSIAEPYVFADENKKILNVITVTDTLGCQNSDSITVNFNVTPKVNINPGTLKVCKNATAQFKGSATGEGNSFTWEWSPAHPAINDINTNNPVINGSKLENKQNFTVQITDDKGCKSKEYNAIAQPLSTPVAKGNITPKETYIDSMITFKHNSENTNNIIWQFDDGKQIEDQNPATHSYTDPGDYHPVLTAINNNGCLDKDTLSVTVNLDKHIIYIPNAFKPSSINNANQSLKVFGENIAEKNFIFKVLNKWGEVVYKTHSFQEANQVGWKGNIRNSSKKQQSDVYSWIAKGEFKDGKEFLEKGTVTLIR